MRKWNRTAGLVLKTERFAGYGNPLTARTTSLSQGLRSAGIGLACRTNSTVHPQNCRNKARMYMKTKEEVKKVEELRSRGIEEPNGKRQGPEQSPSLGPRTAGVLLNCSTSRLADSGKSTNDPGMSMKTKEHVKMSWRQEVEKSSVAMPDRLQSPVAVLVSWLLDSQLSTFDFLDERSGNLYESKEQCQNVMDKWEVSVCHAKSSKTRCDNPVGPVLESRFSNNCRPQGGTP